ncbi:carbonic anhydrase [Purpureocillium lavendulum]|uniref:Carbonic anhydrase n=1 Tax=Purpureocillium lavendulum TaxID=1247861 RepID=A0AB34FCG6_9HYPO|nr:carbonic anhydrase [Purpureocillium lavendulum]
MVSSTQDTGVKELFRSRAPPNGVTRQDIYLVHGFLGARYRYCRDILEGWVLSRARESHIAATVRVFRFDASSSPLEGKAPLEHEVWRLRRFFILLLHESALHQSDDHKGQALEQRVRQDSSSQLGQTSDELQPNNNNTNAILFIAHGLGSWIVKGVLAHPSSGNIAHRHVTTEVRFIDADMEKGISDPYQQYLTRNWGIFNFCLPTPEPGSALDDLSSYLRVVDQNFDAFVDRYELMTDQSRPLVNEGESQTTYSGQDLAIWISENKLEEYRTSAWTDSFARVLLGRQASASQTQIINRMPSSSSNQNQYIDNHFPPPVTDPITPSRQIRDADALSVVSTPPKRSKDIAFWQAYSFLQRGELDNAAVLFETISEHILSDSQSLERLENDMYVAAVNMYRGYYNRSTDEFRRIQAGLQRQVQALDFMRKTVGVKHFKTLAIATLNAWCLVCNGKYNAAETLCSTTYKAASQSLGRHHPQTLDAMGCLVHIFRTQGKLAEAIGTAKFQLAESRLANGDYATAKLIFDDVVHHAARVLGNNHPDTLRYKSGQARAALHCGDVNEARNLAFSVAASQFELYFRTQVAEPCVAGYITNLRQPTDEMGPPDQRHRLVTQLLDRLIREDSPPSSPPLPSMTSMSGNLHPFLISTLRLIANIEVYIFQWNALRAGRGGPGDLATARQILTVLYEATNPKAAHDATTSTTVEVPYEVLACSIALDMAALQRTENKGPDDLTLSIELVNFAYERRRSLLGNYHLDTLCAQLDLTIARCLRDLSGTADFPLNGVKQVSDSILKTLQSRLGRLHPEILTAQLWCSTVDLLLHASNGADGSSSVVTQGNASWCDLINSLSDPLVVRERLVNSLLMKMRLAGLLNQSGLIAKIMETMHLDCASLNYVVGIYGLDKKEMLMATKFNSIRRYAKEIIGYEYDKAVDVIKKENAIVASKDIQGRYNETIYWDIIMKGAKSLDPATLRTAKGPLDSFTMAEKTAAEKFMDLAGFGTSPANQRRYRRLWKSLASMRQAGVDRILFYRTKEFNAFCIKNFENEQVSLVEEVLSWERLYGPHIEQLEVRARRLGGLLDIKTAEGGRENRAIFVSLVPLEASLLSVCPIIGVQQGDFLGVFAGKIRYTDTFDALYQIPGPRENLWLDYSQTTGVLNLMRVSPPDGDANVRLDWEFAEGKDGSASALSWRVSVRALRTIMPFEQLIRSAPNIDQNISENTASEYERALELWEAFERRFPGSTPTDIQTLKQYAECIALAAKGRLDKTGKRRPTATSVRNEMRQFCSAWQRSHNARIPPDVRLSMAPYIEGELARKLGLPTGKKAHKKKTFLTIENYVHMQERLWCNDYHHYIHEAYRLDNANLLNTHCFTSARLQEVCQARYQDLECLISWTDGVPEFRLKFTREICKGTVTMQGYSLGQVLRFASQHNTNVLVNHYLGNMSTIDGAGTYLNMRPRTDMVEDFRSATMRWNPGLHLSLSAKDKEELEGSLEYKAVTRGINELSIRIREATTEDEKQQLKDQRRLEYDRRKAIENKRLREIQAAQKIIYDQGEDPHEQHDWRQIHFDRISHMLPPERLRLAKNMTLRAWPRSSEWVSVLKDLIALRENNDNAAYQEVMRPIQGYCAVPSCRKPMASNGPATLLCSVSCNGYTEGGFGYFEPLAEADADVLDFATSASPAPAADRTTPTISGADLQEYIDPDILSSGSTQAQADSAVNPSDLNSGAPPSQSSRFFFDADDLQSSEPEYPIECLLAMWKSQRSELFLVKWVRGKGLWYKILFLDFKGADEDRSWWVPEKAMDPEVRVKRETKNKRRRRKRS